MRLLTLFANLLLVLGLGGLVLLGAAEVLHIPGAPGRAALPGWPAGFQRPAPLAVPTALPAVSAALAGDASTLVTTMPALPAAPAATEEAPAAEAEDLPAPLPPVEPTPVPHPLPITRLRAARIGLAADVVPAPLIQVGRDTTWDVPAFKVGHGEMTAGAGEIGNAVLLGHVTSLDAGNVFRDLYRMSAGDVVDVFSGERQFTYVVVAVRRVPRTDLSLLQPTDTASVSLITCIGVWLPALQDYSERLVVRAELVASAA